MTRLKTAKRLIVWTSCSDDRGEDRRLKGGVRTFSGFRNISCCSTDDGARAAKGGFGTKRCVSMIPPTALKN